MADTYRVKEAFAYTDKNGVPRVVAPGFLMSGDDPDYKRFPHMFEPVEVAAARAAGVEDATAEPGALRSVSTKRKPGRPRKVDSDEAETEKDT